MDEYEERWNAAVCSVCENVPCQCEEEIAFAEDENTEETSAFGTGCRDDAICSEFAHCYPVEVFDPEEVPFAFAHS